MMSASRQKPISKQTRESILQETAISEEEYDYHLKTTLSPEEYQRYLKDVRKQDPAFLSLLQNGKTAEVVRELLKETWLDVKKRNSRVENIIRDEGIYLMYLEEIEKTDKEAFLEELNPALRQKIEDRLERNEIFMAERLVCGSKNSRAIHLFQQWEITKREERGAHEVYYRQVMMPPILIPPIKPNSSSEPDRTNRRNILILGETQVDTLYVVNAIINYLETATPTGKKVKSTNDYCECDNWHSYILEGQHGEICLIPLYDDFLALNKHQHVSKYLQNITINGTILALGMDIGEEVGGGSLPENLVHCYDYLFDAFDMSDCLYFFESSFASEKEKLSRRFWFVTNQLNNCRNLRSCETKANKIYQFMKNDWERDVQEMVRLFEAIDRVNPRVINMLIPEMHEPGVFTGEIRIIYKQPFTIYC